MFLITCAPSWIVLLHLVIIDTQYLDMSRQLALWLWVGTPPWIDSLHNEELITFERVIEQIEYLRIIGRLTFTVVSTHCITTSYTKINEHRVFFDSFRPILCSSLYNWLRQFQNLLSNYRHNLFLPRLGVISKQILTENIGTAALWRDIQRTSKLDYGSFLSCVSASPKIQMCCLLSLLLTLNWLWSIVCMISMFDCVLMDPKWRKEFILINPIILLALMNLLESCLPCQLD